MNIASRQASPLVVRESEESPEYGVDKNSPWRAILFNCSCHSFEEVITQLVKCGLSHFQAEFTAYEVHFKGQAIVFEGSKTEASRITRSLTFIGLKAEVIKQ